ncbi:hypothetical protein J437_LFUL012803 [Ladona fulva]|uniref:Carbonic anhydrase n=1 Tax=Ladona fulva TaxID=123851 RepID=A0A8K0KKY4_LADFU|nr:hypothetical protein J437_LFUL012803 [Ladona fulva]
MDLEAAVRTSCVRSSRMTVFLASAFLVLLISLFNSSYSCPTAFESLSNGTGSNEGLNARLTRQIHTSASPLPIEGGGLTELEFGYKAKDGPATWPNKFRWCSKNKQSPININLDSSEVADEETIFFQNYNLIPQQISIVNNGKTINLAGTWNPEDRPFIESSLLEDEYVFEALHFHWGRNENEGSEHFINGESYPLEMHLVHFKRSYRSFPRSVNYIDGLAVLSYVFEVQQENNHHFNEIIEATNRIQNVKAQAELNPFSLHHVARSFHNDFVSYKGSLTTPPCNEIVTWFVSLKPLKIGVEQLQKLRRLKDDDGDLLVKNFRPVQPLHGREILFVPKY